MTNVRRVEPKHWKLESKVSETHLNLKFGLRTCLYVWAALQRKELNWSNIKVSL